MSDSNKIVNYLGYKSVHLKSLMTRKNFANVMYRVFYCIEVKFGYQQYMCKRKTRSNRNMNLKRRLLRIS